jgi:hypothetical protein
VGKCFQIPSPPQWCMWHGIWNDLALVRFLNSWTGHTIAARWDSRMGCSVGCNVVKCVGKPAKFAKTIHHLSSLMYLQVC